MILKEKNVFTFLNNTIGVVKFMVDTFYNKLLFNCKKTQIVRETTALTTVFAPTNYMLSRALILRLHKAASQFAKISSSLANLPSILSACGGSSSLLTEAG